MKTPMQELIEWLDKHGDMRIYGGRELTISEIKTKAKSLLEKEKEQILQSLNDGKAMALGNIENKSLEQYYNETFNT